MEATATPASRCPSPPSCAVTSANALRGPARQARLASWRRMSGSGAMTLCGTRLRGDDLALLVHRDRLDRRRADVDPDGNRAAADEVTNLTPVS